MEKWIFDHKLAGTEKYFYDPEYIPPLRRPPNLKVLELPPPKRFLLEGSSWFTSPDTHYMILPAAHKPEDKNKNNLNVCVDKLRIKPDRIQLIRIMYYFIREKDIMAEKPGGYMVFSYIIPKQALYKVTSIKTVGGKNSRYRRSVKRISLCWHHITSLNTWPTIFMKRWMQAMYDAVKADIPDVVDECRDMKKRIIALMLQHRIGKAIPGLDNQLIDNIGTLTQCKYTTELSRSNIEAADIPDDVTSAVAYEAELHRKLRKQTVYKFIPTLKQTGSMNKGFQAMLGKHYNKPILKIINRIYIGMAVPGNAAHFISKFDNIPKPLKHWMSHLLKENTEEANEMIRKIIAEASRILNDENEIAPHIVSNWVTTMKRLNGLVPWHIWEDLYRIADILRIRVRPAQFLTIEQIIDEHDRHAERMRNTKVFVIGVPENEYQFVEVDYPPMFIDSDGTPIRKWIIKQILSQKGLRREHSFMGHCVDTYGSKCMRGESVIFSIQDEWGNRMFTAEYDKNFKFRQAESAVGLNKQRRFPDDAHIKEFFEPLGKVIHTAEAKKPLTYELRASVNTTLIKLKWELSILQNSNDQPDGIEIINIDKLESDITQHIKDIAIMEEVKSMILRNDEPSTIMDKLGQVKANKRIVKQVKSWEPMLRRQPPPIPADLDAADFMITEAPAPIAYNPNAVITPAATISIVDNNIPF